MVPNQAVLPPYPKYQTSWVFWRALLFLALGGLMISQERLPAVLLEWSSYYSADSVKE